MGALEFKPSEHSRLLNRSVEISIDAMNELCENILLKKKELDVNLHDHDDLNNTQAMNDILRIGSSAGGAKPKAIIAMNDAGHVLSGQVDAPDGYQHWMVKFDIAGEFDRARNNGIPPASGRIEYAYYLMAKAANMDMHECRLLEIGHYGHFLTQRFDRIGNKKVHVQTLAAIEHLDRDQPHDYAQLMATARKLNLGMPAVHEIFRRMVFNVFTFNHDDHTKNHGFLMTQQGDWSLSPAYDVTYAFDPSGKWTKQHQMSIFGKHDNLNTADLLAAAERCGITARHAQRIIDEVRNAAAQWGVFAEKAGLDKQTREIIAKLLRKYQ
jgi:serine/threonine-protein kinase HipA